MINGYWKEHPRLANQVILGLVSLLSCLIMVLMSGPDQSLLEKLSIGTGYIGLGMIVVTLLIGPLNMLKVRKNPVNLIFRRDTGIWAGINSLAHVGLAFALEINWGGTLLGFFLYKDGSLKLNLFGISNYLGLVATLVIIFLLVLSNNRSLKALKGKRWKTMQRFNYLLFGVALIHTVTQQINNVRGYWLILAVLAGTIAVMIGQFVGFVVYRQREQDRKAGQSATAIPGNKANAGISKVKLASAFGLSAVLGVGVSIAGINFVNGQTSSSTGSVASTGNSEVDSGNSTSTDPSSTPVAIAEENEALEVSVAPTEEATSIPTTAEPSIPATITPAAIPTNSPVPAVNNTQASSTATPNSAPTTRPTTKAAAATPTPAPATKAPTATPVPATKKPTATPVPTTKAPAPTLAPSSAGSKGRTTVTKPSTNPAPVHSGGS